MSPTGRQGSRTQGGDAGRRNARPPAQSASRRPTKNDVREARRAETARRKAEEEAKHRRRRTAMWGGGGVLVVAAAVAIILAVVLPGSGGSNGTGSSAPPLQVHFEVQPPPVATGAPDVQPPALEVKNPTGIPGVVAYDTTGWPTTSHNGPASKALGHNHVDGSVTYSVIPPVGGDHNGTWMNCGVYDQPVPNERAVHNLEHGAVWITYRPSLPVSELAAIRAFVGRQSIVDNTGSRYVDMSPYPGLPAPIVISSWGFQLRVTSPNDPRLQRFVDTFRSSQTYTPEYGGECTGGVGTPLYT